MVKWKLLLLLLFNMASLSVMGQFPYPLFSPGFYFAMERYALKYQQEYDWQIILKNDSSFNIKSSLYYFDKVQLVSYQIGNRAASIRPADTKLVFILNNGKIDMMGLPSDSCWFFQSLKGEINVYSKIPTHKLKHAALIQKGTGPLVPLSRDNLLALIADDPEMTDYLEANGFDIYGKVIVRYNSRKEKK